MLRERASSFSHSGIERVFLTEPSYVIQALGLGEKVNKVLRVSINKYTTKDDITSFLELLRSI